MRAAAVVFLTALLLAVAGTIAAAAGVYQAHDQVALTERTVYGDRAAADGLTVGLRANYDHHLFWDTTYAVEREPVMDTGYRFSAKRDHEDGQVRYLGVEMETYPQTVSRIGHLELLPEEGLARAYRELAETVEPGEQKRAEVYLKDYMDYYPVGLSVDVPGTTIFLDGETLVEEESLSPGTELYALRKIQEHFKIPVQEDERVTISLTRNVSGELVGAGMSSGEGDHYYMGTLSEVTGDACYFTFDTHTSDGAVVDTSHLPEGYGIYRLPYEEVRVDEELGRVCGVDADGLEMVYPLEPEITPIHLHTDPEENRLLFHAWEDGKYVLRVIDLATMETLQRLELWDREEDAGVQVYDQGDFLMVTHGNELAVLTPGEKGYQVEFTCTFQQQQVPAIYTELEALAFDGEKLAAAGMLWDEHSGMRTVGNFFLAVWDASGLRYYGEYESSLDTGVDRDNYSFYCHFNDYAPMTLRWHG